MSAAPNETWALEAQTGEGLLALIANDRGCERPMLGMEIAAEQFALIEHCLPRQCGNVSMPNLQLVNAVLYVAGHGCKWRGLP